MQYSRRYTHMASLVLLNQIKNNAGKVVVDEEDVGDEIAVLPKLIWNHVIHDVVMQSSSDGTTARAVDKSGKHAQSKQKKHMKEMAKKNSKQNKSKVSYNRANS